MGHAYRPTNLLCAIVSALGVTAYYSELLKPLMPAWLAVGLSILPVALVVLVVPGEASDRIVGAAHLFAAGATRSRVVGGLNAHRRPASHYDSPTARMVELAGLTMTARYCNCLGESRRHAG